MKKNTHLFTIALLVATAWPSLAQAQQAFVFRGSHDGSIAEITNSPTGLETFNLDSTSGAGTTSASYTYTIGGIDAAADGTANDMLTAVFGVISNGTAGGNITFQDDGNFGVSGNNAGNLNGADESLMFSLISSSVSLGDGGTGSVTGGGYNQIQFSLLNSASETALLSGTDMDGSITGTTTFAPVSTFSVGHNGDGSSFRVGPARYRFVVTTETATIPEPSSAVILAGIGALAMVRRTRKTL